MVEEQKLRMEKDREKEQKKEEVSWGNIFTIITGYNWWLPGYVHVLFPFVSLIFFYDKVRMQRVVIGWTSMLYQSTEHRELS